MAYEYKILMADRPEITEERLNEGGREGWLLVTIVPWQGAWYYYFAREKP